MDTKDSALSKKQKLEDEQDEPLLKINPKRFVLKPIQYPEVE
jgi:hypothetical protein